MQEGNSALKKAFEKDREGLLMRLRQDPDPEKAQALLQDELMRLGLIAGEEDPKERTAWTAGLFATARAAVPFLTCFGQAEVYERKTGSKSERSRTGKILTAISLILFAVVALILVLEKSGLVPVLFLAAAVAILFMAGSLTRKRKDPEWKVESRVDPDRVVSALYALVLVIDRERSAFCPGKEQQSTAKDAALPADPDLYGKLLEALYGNDAEYALEAAGQVPYLLHRQGIEAVSFDGTNGQYFELMPGTMTKTMRPALIRDGELLQKGMAVKA